MKKKLIIPIIILAALWAALFITDFLRVRSFEKPVFCIVTDAADDGGSGHYRGLGYSFDIEGNFMPEDELPGVTRYRGYLFGLETGPAIRD